MGDTSLIKILGLNKSSLRKFILLKKLNLFSVNLISLNYRAFQLFFLISLVANIILFSTLGQTVPAEFMTQNR